MHEVQDIKMNHMANQNNHHKWRPESLQAPIGLNLEIGIRKWVHIRTTGSGIQKRSNKKSTSSFEQT